MLLRLSTLFVRTLREDPAEAEVPSHRLLVRAGYVRRVAPGGYAWLPLGKPVVVVVGRRLAEGHVEVRSRVDGSRSNVPLDGSVELVSARCGG